MVVAHPGAHVAADLTSLSLAEAGDRIAARELSPVELVEATLNRIEEVDEQLNSFIHVSGEQALGIEVELGQPGQLLHHRLVDGPVVSHAASDPNYQNGL